LLPKTGDSLRISHGRGILEIHHSSTTSQIFSYQLFYGVVFFLNESILLSIIGIYKNIESFAGFYLTNTVQTTNIMSFSLLKRKGLLLSQRRLKHRKVVRGTISLLFSIIYTFVQVLMLDALVNVANSGTASFKAPGGTYRSSFEQKSNYQTPASALYGAYEGSSSQGSSSSYGKICIHRFLVFFMCCLTTPSIFYMSY
jgi:hypothetical protein